MLSLDARSGLLPAPPAAAARWPLLSVERQTTPRVADFRQPPLTHHLVLLYFRPSAVLDRECAGLAFEVPPPVLSCTFIPAGQAARWRWQGRFDVLSVFLDPAVIQRAELACGFAPGSTPLAPAFDLDAPAMRSTLLALAAELGQEGAGGLLLAESLADVLAVHLVRHFARRPPAPLPEAPPSPGAIAAAIEYIHAHLAEELRLGDLAAVAGLSTHHFARQFRRSVGLPPHQYVVAERVEWAKRLLVEGRLSPAQVALRVGFADQSHFTRHFKRLVGVTPGRFV